MSDYKYIKGIPNINNRFISVLEQKKYTGYRFSKEMELSESVITNIRKGKNEPSKKYLTALLEKFPDVSNVWLLTGEGDMLTSVSKQKSEHSIKNDTITGYYYPTVSAAAGMDKEMANDELERIPISLPNWDQGIDFINVYGDSMYPKFCSGEIIGIKQVELQYINYGFAYVVILGDGQILLKYIKKGSDKDHVILESENKFYDSKEYQLSQIKKVFIIKGVISKITM
ncbi:MAG: hypothetical protein BM557_01990 [Flavobacterium sp. MedPE-SWcel]|uniref:LexA family transcriptional regulator n=1 Tax=uncultured Flavobacterium sp. TaxID=165435 RepID=UPI00091ABF3D|nr:XRE family transcriptional regulator [uncultured Flavobacterium sp.]OIQ22168.1 MAG: hypothetical protein BM557_01990 [Flavobacterium sp. MedPE-SWcel]